MFKELDPLLHSQLRLAIMSLLLGLDSADFTFLKEKTNSTAGNISVQLDKLSDAGYISIEKSFNGKKPLTTCRITKKGIKAFEDYVHSLKTYIKIKIFYLFSLQYKPVYNYEKATHFHNRFWFDNSTESPKRGQYSLSNARNSTVFFW
jgi:DNA-binding transcriptional ArsR family regulator